MPCCGRCDAKPRHRLARSQRTLGRLSQSEPALFSLLLLPALDRLRELLVLLRHLREAVSLRGERRGAGARESGQLTRDAGRPQKTIWGYVVSGDVLSRERRQQRDEAAMPDTSASIATDPKHWRDRAEEARAMAVQMSDREARNMMLDIAESYEKLANRAEKRAAGLLP